MAVVLEEVEVEVKLSCRILVLVLAADTDRDAGGTICLAMELRRAAIAWKREEGGRGGEEGRKYIGRGPGRADSSDDVVVGLELPLLIVLRNCGCTPHPPYSKGGGGLSRTAA